MVAVHRSLPWALTGATLLTSIACGSAPAVDEPAPVRRAAPVARTVAVAVPDAPPIGIAMSGAICGETLYAVDARHAAVHEIRLADGVRARTLSGPDVLSDPETVAADCDSGSIYVTDAEGIAVFDADTGDLRRRLDGDRRGLPALGRSFVAGDSLIVPGYWSPGGVPADLASHPLEGALRGFSLGRRIDITGKGASEPLLDLLSPECRQSGTSCFSTAGVDRLADGGWIGCQGTAPLVGIYAADGALLRTIDVRSPLFRDDGTVARASAPREARLRWHQRNSVVRSCFAFGDHIVTVHYTFTGEGGTPDTGGAVPDVLMNVHRLDGTPVALDLALRDMPVARDASHLYVLVLGDARRGVGADRVEVDVVPILDEAGALSPGLTP